MSADNGIYILKTKKSPPPQLGALSESDPRNFVYRVAHVQAIDNFDYYAEKEPTELHRYMKNTWGTSPVFTEESAALVEAARLFKTCEYVEYGISFIDGTEYFFPGDL